MDRRRFLQATLGTAIAWVLSRPATAGLLQADSASYGNPVTFVEPDLGQALYGSDFSVDPTADPSGVFTASVAAGDPRPNGIVLWTRLDPAAMADPANPEQLLLEIAADPNFSAGSILIRAKADISADSDYTAKLPIAKSVLSPGQTYYYRFIYSRTASRVGRFKTLPAATSAPSRIKLGYISCQDYSNGYYTALAHLAEEDLDYIVFLGDYIYETVSDPSFQGQQVRTVPPLPSGGTVAASLDDYRHLYRVYRSDPDLQALHERFTFIQIWDDHEFANDCWQDYHPDNNPTPDQPTPELRQAANQAWVEYCLADVAFDPAAEPTASVQNYRKFEFGRLLDLIVTDERLYRDGPPCGYDTANRYLTERCAAAEDASRTMLGATQRDWFLNGLRTSDAVWKLWANELTLMQMQVDGVYVTLDQWDGYPAERAEILNSIGLAGIKNLVAITGDIHSFIAGYLMADYAAQTPPVGIELVVGSVTSANFQELITSQIPLPSAPIPVAPRLDGRPLEALMLLTNPHMVYFNSSTHGYSVLDITPDSLLCIMKAVDTISEPSSGIRVLKKFVVQRDQAVLESPAQGLGSVL